MGKEKLNYVLNPDGLTESIFVARGEKNEGEYRGKRFTKAGLKAERKRQQDELRASIVTPASLEDVGELNQKESSGLSYEDYYSNNDTETVVEVEHVKIHGGIIGWLGVFDEKGNMIKYHEKGSFFNNKEEIKQTLKDLNVTANKIKFLKTKQNAFIFKGEGSITKH